MAREGQSDVALGVSIRSGATLEATLQASLSGTFLQTLPATEGAQLLISAQLSTDAVSALRKVWVLIRPLKRQTLQART